MVVVDFNAAATSDKLRKLGWKPRKLEETLADSVKSYENAGLLHVSDGEPCRLPFLFRLPPLEE
jgi:hypothetical protein